MEPTDKEHTVRRRVGDDSVDTELNLVPIMNLFTALIPFLLLSAAFIQVKVINASVPAIADGSDPVNEDKAYEKRPVVVNVQIGPRGYHVSASGDDVSPRELQQFKNVIPVTGKDDYDTDKLQAYLSGVKAKFPKSDTIIIAPGRSVRYERIVEVMDTSRELPPTDGKKRYLFPKVVVTSLHE